MEPSRWSRTVTIAVVLMLAGIAAVVSYSHMYELALRHGEPPWRAALFPLSVDGMIVGASMALLSDARRGRKGGFLPWALLIIGSAASLAANVAVADPTMWSRIIHAWPSFALIGAYELLMREFRNTARSVRTASANIPQDGTRVTGERAAVPETDEAHKDTSLRIVPRLPMKSRPALCRRSRPGGGSGPRSTRRRQVSCRRGRRSRIASVVRSGGEGWSRSAGSSSVDPWWPVRLNSGPMSWLEDEQRRCHLRTWKLQG